VGVVHRDIRPSNVLELEVGKDILLIDWGFATTNNNPVPYSGTLHYAADEILRQDDLSSFVFCSRHDLHSFIRTVYMVNHSSIRKRLSKLSLSERGKIVEFYEKNLPIEWTNLSTACDELDYESLSHQLATINEDS